MKIKLLFSLIFSLISCVSVFADCNRFGSLTSKIEQRLSKNECHEYSVELQNNQYLKIIAEQKGVDLKLELFDEAGVRVVDEADSPNKNHGTEFFVFISPKTSIYRLRVSWVDSDETYISAGEYQINLEELRAIKDTDKALVESVNKAEKLFKTFEKKNFIEAIGIYENLLKQNDFTWLKYRLSLIKRELARDYAIRGNNQEAVNLFSQSLELAVASNDKSLQGENLSSLGLANYRLGNFKESEQFLLQSIPVIEKFNNPDDLANAFTRLVITLIKLGKLDSALEYSNKSEQINSAATFTKLTIQNNKGLIFSSQGKRGEALKIYEPLPELFLQRNAYRDAAIALSNIVGIYESLGEKDKAKEILNKTLLLADKSPSPAQIKSMCFYYLGRVEPNKQKAIKFFNDALKEYEMLKDIDSQAIIYNQIGISNHSLGTKGNFKPYKTAISYYKKAANIYEQTGNQIDLAQSLNNIGAANYLIGNESEATSNYLAALKIYQGYGGKSGEAETLHNLMFLWNKPKTRQIAINYGIQSVNTYQKLRLNIEGLNEQIQKNYAGRISDTYRKLASLLIDEGRISEAERVMEFLKYREFEEFTQGGDKIALEPLKLPTLTKKEEETIKKFDEIADSVFVIGKEIDQLEDEKQLLLQANQPFNKEKRLVELKQKLVFAKAAFKKYLSGLRTKLGSGDTRITQLDSRLQAKLRKLKNSGMDAGRFLSVTTIMEENRLNLIVTTINTQKAYAIDVSRIEINRLVAGFRKSLTDSNSADYKISGQKLYDFLIKPIRKDLADVETTTIIWSLDDSLRYIPVAALYDKTDGFLIQKYANVNILLSDTDTIISDRKTKWQSVGFGVSKPFENFSSLVSVPDELDCIIEQPNKKFSNNQPICQKGLLPGLKFIDEEFTIEKFQTASDQANLIHIATHFDLKETIDDSFLLVGGGENRKYTLKEIEESQHFDADLVYLSACSTAAPAAERDGKEIESFATIVQKLGGQSVIATLWVVAHRSTTRFNRKFYELYLNSGLNKAEALRQSQLFMSGLPDRSLTNQNFAMQSTTQKQGDFPHPYYWSPFVLFGNWK